MKNFLIKNLTALSVLVSAGMMTTPAEAGIFVFNGGSISTQTTPGAPIWYNTFPGTSPGPVDGWDNPSISLELEPQYDAARIKVEYFGSGLGFVPSVDVNLFKFNGMEDMSISWCSPGNKSCDGVQNVPVNGVSGQPGLPVPFANMTYENVGRGPNPNSWQTPSPFMRELWIGEGLLDFTFLADAIAGSNSDGHKVVVGNGGIYPNGCNPNSPPCSPTNAAHYFATIDGTLGTTEGTVFYMGLSDEARTGGDNDAEDFMVRVTVLEQIRKTPEPGTILGLLAAGTVGMMAKRQKQK